MPESVHVFALEEGPFRAVTLGLQQAIVLPLSFGICVADQLVFREGRGESKVYTGAWLCRRVTHEERGVHLDAVVGVDGQGRALLCENDVASAIYSFNRSSENESAHAHLAHRLTHARKEGLTQEQFWNDEAAREAARRQILRAVG